MGAGSKDGGDSFLWQQLSISAVHLVSETVAFRSVEFLAFSFSFSLSSLLFSVSAAEAAVLRVRGKEGEGGRGIQAGFFLKQQGD